MKPAILVGALVVGIGLLFFLVYVGGSTVLPVLVGGESPHVTDVSGTSLIGARAPYFDLPSLSGDHITLDSFANTPLIIVFWTTASTEGVDQIKILDDFRASVDSGQQLVQVIAINSQEEKSVVTSFMRRGGYTVPTLIDARGTITESYKVRGTPVLYFLDADGIVREIYTGSMSAQGIGDSVERLLGGATL